MVSLQQHHHFTTLYWLLWFSSEWTKVIILILNPKYQNMFDIILQPHIYCIYEQFGRAEARSVFFTHYQIIWAKRNQEVPEQISPPIISRGETPVVRSRLNSKPQDFFSF